MAIQTIIYDYFSKNYGTSSEDNKNGDTKYRDMSCKQLKKCLTDLKGSSGNAEDIKWVSRTLRAKLKRDKNVAKIEATNLEESMRKNFGKRAGGFLMKMF